MKKKIICMIIAITVILSCFVGCDKTEPEESSSPLKVVDTVSDPWGRELQKIYYNEITQEYIIKEFIYQYVDEAYVCVDQRTTIIRADERPDINIDNSSSVTIYYNSDLADRPTVIMDNEYARVTVKKFLSKDSWWEFGYDIEILNKTAKVISVSFDNVYIMDIACKPMFSIDHLEAGKTANFMLGWDRDTLERCYIPYVDNIEFMVRVFDNDDWDTTALAGARVLFKN